MTDIDIKPLTFTSAAQWRKWLDEHHAAAAGAWLRFYKKATGLQTFTFEEALDEALCYGWIDGQGRSLDEKSYLQKFTPRRARSMWSKRNTEHIARLTKLGKMKEAGLREVAAARADGRWAAAYEPPSTMTIPDDFLKELKKNKKAEAFFKTLNKSNRYAIGWKLATAKKPQTRAARMKAILDNLARSTIKR